MLYIAQNRGQNKKYFVFKFKVFEIVDSEENQNAR